MKRIWINYNKWEDYKNGLFETKKLQNEGFLIDECVKLLSDQNKFYSCGVEMINAWSNSANHNLSDIKANRKSYIGKAVCNFIIGANIKTTIKAWNTLSDETKELANNTALSLISYYEENVYIEPRGVSCEKLS